MRAKIKEKEDEDYPVKIHEFSCILSLFVHEFAVCLKTMISCPLIHVTEFVQRLQHHFTVRFLISNFLFIIIMLRFHVFAMIIDF